MSEATLFDSAGAQSDPGVGVASYTRPPMSTLEEQLAAGTHLDIEYDKRLMLFTGRANPALAANIADKLGVEVGGLTTKTFSNGEVYCRFHESIRGADVFLIQPICANPELGLTANDALMELMVMVDAAVGGSAHRVIAVCPGTGTAARTRSRLRASRSAPVSSPGCSRQRGSIGS